MTKLRIIGGGLTGVLAAFEAHHLGFRDIEIHERLQGLGGADESGRPHGLELRGELVDFGPRDAPMRQLLEWRGATFDDEDIPVDEVGAQLGRGLNPASPGGTSLAHWIRSNPPELAGPLGRYCQWRLGVWLDEVDASAAGALDLIGRPREALATPRGGVSAMFATCRRALDELGVTTSTGDEVSASQAIAAQAGGEVVAWAADPAPLFEAFDLPAPPPLAASWPTYVFRADPDRLPPLRLRNFAPGGLVADLRLYGTRGAPVLAAECVTKADEGAVRREIARLVAGFGEEACDLGEALGFTLRPRHGLRSVKGARQLARLRAKIAETCGPALVSDAWEPLAPADRLAGLRRGLAAARDGLARPLAAAA